MIFGLNIPIYIFSHIIPSILGFLAILFIVNGMFDEKRNITLIGVGMFALAVAIPFIVIPFLI